MATVAVLNVAIRATTEQLEAGVKKASRSIQRFASGIGSVVGKVTALGTAVAATGAAIFAAFVRRTQTTIESLAKMQQQTGINVDSLNAMRFGAQRLGISVGTLEGSLIKFTRSLGLAAGGSTSAIKKFSDLGLNIDQLAKGGSTEAFLATIDAISSLGTAAEQSAAAQRIFGRSAAELLPLIQGGASGIADLRDKISDFGLELNQVDVTSIREMNIAIRELQLSFGGLVNRLTVELAPVLTVIIERITRWRRETTKTGNVTGGIVEATVNGFKAIVQVVNATISVIKEMQSGWSELLAVIFDANAAVAEFFGQTGTAFLARQQAGIFRDQADELNAAAERLLDINGKDFLKDFNAAIAAAKDRFKKLADEVEKRSGAIRVIAPEDKATKSASRSFGIEAAERGSAQAIAVLARITGSDREAVQKEQLAEAKKQTQLQRQRNRDAADMLQVFRDRFPRIQTAEL